MAEGHGPQESLCNMWPLRAAGCMGELRLWKRRALICCATLDKLFNFLSTDSPISEMDLLPRVAVMIK